MKTPNRISNIANRSHFGRENQPTELVTSFMGEGETVGHCSHQPDTYTEDQMGSLWTDIRDELTSGLQTGVSEAAGGVIGVVAQQPEVQAIAQQSALKVAQDWAIKNWKPILGVAVGVTAVTAWAVTRGAVKRKYRKR